MSDFRINLDKNIVIKLLTEFVPFETSGHKTQKDYDEWIKKGIKKWSKMSSNTLLGKIFNKDYKNNDINKTEIDRNTNKYFIIPDNSIEDLDDVESPINLMEESTSSLFDNSPKNLFSDLTSLLTDKTKNVINKYNLFNNISDDTLINDNMHIINEIDEIDDIFDYSSSDDDDSWNSNNEYSLDINNFIDEIFE